jgi:hypothetical protein
MPNVEDVMWRISQSTFISCYDTTSGYWQTAMAEDSAWLTGFVTHRGLYEWVRSPFGLKNSGAKFVRMLQTVLQPIKNIAEAYVDDTGVHSKTWSTHMINTVAFLTIMRKAGSTLNLGKTVFAQSELKMVGHYVGSGKHRPDPEKLKVIENLPRPRTRTELRRVLGMMGYHRAYNPNFAQAAKCLTDLTTNPQYIAHF